MAGIQYLIIVPLAASFLIVLFGKRFKAAGESLATASSLALIALSVSIARSVLSHKSIIFKVGNWLPPFGIPLVADGLSAFILIVANFVVLTVVLYSIGYVKNYTDNWKYYALIMIMTAGVNGVVMTGDIFNLFVFLEIASIATYALVAFTTEDEALEGAFKYAVMSAVASSFIFLGIALLYSYTSTLTMADMASVLAVKGPAMVVPFVSALFIMGFGLKSALAPFHAWVPDAYTRSPATIPAMSSGVLIKTLGVYSLIRIFFNVFGMNTKISVIFIGLGLVSMVAGSILAFGQSNMRRLLGYSSISQVGYILLGLGIGTPLAIFGALFHLVNHSVAKALLFLNAGAIENYAGTSDCTKISGIIGRDRVCGYTDLVAAMSISGIPPLGGFWSKLIIIFACIQAHHPIFAAVAVIVSIVTLAYYSKAFTTVLFGPVTDRLSDSCNLTRAMKIALVLLAFSAAFAGFALLPGAANLFIQNTVTVLTNGTMGYIHTVFGAIK